MKSGITKAQYDRAIAEIKKNDFIVESPRRMRVKQARRLPKLAPLAVKPQLKSREKSSDFQLQAREHMLMLNSQSTHADVTQPVTERKQGLTLRSSMFQSLQLKFPQSTKKNRRNHHIGQSTDGMHQNSTSWGHNSTVPSSTQQWAAANFQTPWNVSASLQTQSLVDSQLQMSLQQPSARLDVQQSREY